MWAAEMNRALIITPLISAAQIQYNTIHWAFVLQFEWNCTLRSTRIWGKIDVSKYIYLSFLRSESKIDASCSTLAAMVAVASLPSASSF